MVSSNFRHPVPIEPWTEFCEAADPSIVRALRNNPSDKDAVHNHSFSHPGANTLGPSAETRVQQSFTAGIEKCALLWCAARTPGVIVPDHMTALGLLAQIAAGACYALAATNRFWLLGATTCLALNWLGDSLDGTLARFRRQPRPRYGFYVDHMVDSFGALALMGGLGLSGYMHPWFAAGLLVAFFLLSIQSYLATHVLGEFRLSFWRFGPTELRILLGVGNLALLWKPHVQLSFLHHFGDFPSELRLFDVGGVIGLAGMVIMLFFFTTQNTIRLYREERLPR